MADAVAAFAAEVGPPDAGAVVAVGGRTQWEVGGPLAEGVAVREVRAPEGVVAVEAADMTVRVRAGTTVADLDDALAEVGQTVALPAWAGATVGGVLAVGHSGLRRLGWGPVRDTVLEVRYVSADGTIVKAGGPTVKNVSGFDLCRLLVGSVGTLGLIAEVVLRTRPLPACERWLAGPVDPLALRAVACTGAASILWDGTTTWVLLDGHPADVDAQAALAADPSGGDGSVAAGARGSPSAGRAAGSGGTAGRPDMPDVPDDASMVEVGGPPDLPPHRWSLRPSELPALAAPAGGSGPTGGGRVLAEVGVGIVHADVVQPPRPADPAVVALHARLKDLFDPTGRIAPGRSPVAAAQALGAR